MKIVKVSGVKVADDADVVAARLSRVASNVGVHLGRAAMLNAAGGSGAKAAANAHSASASAFNASVVTYDGEASIDDMNQALSGTPYQVAEFDSMTD